MVIKNVTNGKGLNCERPFKLLNTKSALKRIGNNLEAAARLPLLNKPDRATRIDRHRSTCNSTSRRYSFARRYGCC